MPNSDANIPVPSRIATEAEFVAKYAWPTGKTGAFYDYDSDSGERLACMFFVAGPEAGPDTPPPGVGPAAAGRARPGWRDTRPRL